MELLQLRYFHEVAQTQHMTNSAKRLGVAQPALTQAIRRLEGELDAKLFERAGRNIRLTPCGEALEAKVAPLLAAFDEIPLAIAQAKGQERNTVRIDVEAATSMTVDAIAVFRATVPQAAFVINQANSEARWDVRVRTVTPGGGGKPDARTSQVFRERICLAIPKEQAKGNSVCLADFADAPFVCLAGTRGFRGVCDELCLKAGFAPNVVFESDSPDVVRKFIALGLGVGFWPERSWGALEGSDVALAPIRESRVRARYRGGNGQAPAQPKSRRVPRVPAGVHKAADGRSGGISGVWVPQAKAGHPGLGCADWAAR